MVIEYEGDAKALGTVFSWRVGNEKGLGENTRVVAAAAVLKVEEDFDAPLACLTDQYEVVGSTFSSLHLRERSGSEEGVERFQPKFIDAHSPFGAVPNSVRHCSGYFLAWEESQRSAMDDVSRPRTVQGHTRRGFT